MSEDRGPSRSGPAVSSRARELAAAFVVVWLVIQIGLPTVALFTDRPERFSWQMFSALSDHPSYVLVYDDGSREEVSHGDVLPWVRADVDYRTHLPRHLCQERAPRLQRVQVVPRGEDEAERTHHCRVEAHLSGERG
jgi:hypothetical protein